MTDHPDPVVSSGGFCGPSDELYKFFKPREIPGTLDELTATWDTNVTTTREQATAYLMRGRYARGNRADHEATAWQEVATTLRSVPVVTELPDVWAGFAQAQADLVAALPRKTPERRRARANSYVYDLAAIELRICLNGGGPMPSPQSALPVVTAPRGAIRFITPPAAPKRPCDCGATDVHELGTGPYCSALAEYGAAAEAPGPDWKAKLREQVMAGSGDVQSDGWNEAIAEAVRLIDALPDPPTPDPDAPPVYEPPEGHVAPVLGENVRDGWEGHYVGESGYWWDARTCRAEPNALFEVRRVPAPEPATEWVPLTKLVGRTIKGETKAVAVASSAGGKWVWCNGIDGLFAPFPTRDDGMVEVLAEGER